MTKTLHGALGAPAAAGLCLGAAVLLYHIPLGDSLAADALHACLAAAAALACLALWRGRSSGEAGETQEGLANEVEAQAGGGRPPSAAVPAAASGAAPDMGACRTARTKDSGSRDLAAPTMAALCVLGAVACVAASAVLGGPAWQAAAGGAFSPACAAVLVASCAGTAVWEEVVFRRLGMEAVAQGLGASAAPGGRLAAACVCSAVFALAHLGEGMGAALWALRGAQVFTFALAMAGLVEKTGRLWPAVAAHMAYDLVCFAPAAFMVPQGSTVWDMPAEMLGTLETGMGGVAASLVFLAPAAVLAVRALLRR